MSAQQDRTIQFTYPWFGATKIFSSLPKISIYIRDSIRKTLGKLREQREFSEIERGRVIQWVKELNADKAQCPGLPEPTGEEYKQFVDESFDAIDNEDRSGVVTVETTQKFREVAFYIGLLENFGMFDEEMKKRKKYCGAKAIDIFKSIKSGVQPRRGGFKEQQQQPKLDDNELEKEIESMSNQIGQMNNGNQQQQQFQMNNGNQQQQQFQMNNNCGYGNQNNFGFGNGNNIGGFSNPYANPQQPANMGGYGNMLQPNNYNNNNNNNNIQMNPNYNPKKKGIRLKFGGKKDKQEQDVAVGPRTAKVTDDPKNRGNKQFEFPNINLSVQVPVQNKTIDYYKVLDNIKKVNYEGLRSVKKGRLKEALNYIEDSLEYLNYLQY